MKTLVTTFPNAAELGRARARLEGLSLPYDIILPSPGYSRVGMDAIVLDEGARMELAEKCADGFISSGCASIFEGEHAELKDALVEICSALGVMEGVPV